MAKVGVLVHVYHLEAVGWEGLVWGDPARDLMGTLPKLIQLLLLGDQIEEILMYTGPSRKDGLDEGEYAKKFLLDHFEQLSDFPQLKPLLDKLSDGQLQALRKQAEGIVKGPQLINSADEVISAAAYFKERGIARVYQLAIASHAPRCIQLQAAARYEHKIPPEQFWCVIAADTTYEGTTPTDVIIAEPPHRGDDPAYGVHPGITDVLKRYYGLRYEQRVPFINGVEHVLESVSND